MVENLMPSPNDEFPESERLVNEIETILEDYNNGDALNIEAITAITNLLVDNHSKTVVEHEKYLKLMANMPKDD